MLPEASQARKAIWEAVDPHTGKRRIDNAFPREMRDTTRENEMFLRFKSGSTWQVVGSDNYNSLVGSPPIGVVFSEWALADPQAWAYLRPILRENGGWALFITTPRGQNHAAEMYEAVASDPEWFTQVLPATQTNVFSPEDLQKEREAYEREFGLEDGRAKYEQEYLCSFTGSLVGAFYGQQMREAEEQDRITTVPHDRAHQVYTSWDIGKRDETAIWFWQDIGYQFRAIDYYEATGLEVADYAKVVSGKPYVYAQHYLPHDAAQERMGMDGRSVERQLNDLGIKPTVIVPSPPGSREAGILETRTGLSRVAFDREKTKRGRQCLTQYRREYDDKNKVFKPTPLHNWASNGADAARTFFMGHSKRVEAVDININVDWVA